METKLENKTNKHEFTHRYHAYMCDYYLPSYVYKIEGTEGAETPPSYTNRDGGITFLKYIGMHLCYGSNPPKKLSTGRGEGKYGEFLIENTETLNDMLLNGNEIECEKALIYMRKYEEHRDFVKNFSINTVMNALRKRSEQKDINLVDKLCRLVYRIASSTAGDKKEASQIAKQNNLKGFGATKVYYENIFDEIFYESN